MRRFMSGHGWPHALWDDVRHDRRRRGPHSGAAGNEGASRRARPNHQLRRFAIVAVVAALAVLLSGCGITRTDAPITLKSDRRLKMVSPGDEDKVNLPVTVKWEVKDFPLANGNHFGLFVDRGLQDRRGARSPPLRWRSIEVPATRGRQPLVFRRARIQVVDGQRRDER